MPDIRCPDCDTLVDRSDDFCPECGRESPYEAAKGIDDGTLKDSITSDVNWIALGGITLVMLLGCFGLFYLISSTQREKTESKEQSATASSERGSKQQSPPPRDREPPDREVAWSLCQSEVQGMLKAPATADYAPPRDVQLLDPEDDYGDIIGEGWLYTPDNTPDLDTWTGGMGIDQKADFFVVIGYVDSENSFGAKLRADVACKVFLEQEEVSEIRLNSP